jgi:hypothetical protein
MVVPFLESIGDKNTKNEFINTKRTIQPKIKKIDMILKAKKLTYNLLPFFSMSKKPT